jgi:hypothetical protein
MSQEVRQKFMETIRQFNETKQLQFQNFFSAVVPKKPVIEPSSCRALN